MILDTNDTTCVTTLALTILFHKKTGTKLDSQLSLDTNDTTWVTASVLKVLFLGELGQRQKQLMTES